MSYNLKHRGYGKKGYATICEDSMKSQVMSGYWCTQYQIHRQRDDQWQSIWGKTGIVSGISKYSVAVGHIQSSKGMNGRYLTFQLYSDYFLSLSLLPSFTNLQVFLKNPMLFRLFKISVLIFSLLVCEYFEFFRSSFSTIPILRNTRRQ